MSISNADKEFWYSKKFTLKGRIFYPQLSTPEVKNGKEKYTVMFAFKPEENQAMLTEIGKFLGEAKAKFWPAFNAAALVNPIKKFETYVRTDGKPNAEYLRGHYWINASSGKDFKPVVVGLDRQPVLSDAEIYSGRNALFNFSFYGIFGSKENGGKNGVSTNIGAIMLLEGGNKEGGMGSINIDEAFGAFAGQMAPAATTDENPFI